MDVFLASDQAPTETELDLASELDVKVLTVADNVESDAVLARSLLELALLVEAFAFQEVDHMLLFGLEQAFALGQLMDRLVDHILLVQALCHVYACQSVEGGA